jgi:hypothetical protein
MKVALRKRNGILEFLGFVDGKGRIRKARLKKANPGDRIYAVGNKELYMEGKGLTQGEAVRLLKQKPMDDLGMHNYIYKFQGTFAGSPSWKRVSIRKK